MGYTHYWRPKGDIDEAVWTKLTEATIGVLSIAKERGIGIVGGMGDPGTEPEINERRIDLNGESPYETFRLEQKPEVPAHRRDRDPEWARFSFCKTGRMPYDEVVTAILCLAEHFSDGYFRVSSDGSPGEWRDGLALARKVASGVQLPPGVSNPDEED